MSAGSDPDACGRAWSAGRLAWPGLDVPEPAFREHASRCRADHASTVHPDLYLACAATLGIAAAHAAIDRLAAPMLDRLARRWRARVDPAELAQTLRIRLFVGTTETPARIASYSGQGALLGWLRVIAARVAVDLSRGAKDESDEALLGLVSDEQPELGYMKHEVRAAFKAAFTNALSALPGADRTLLRLRFVDGLQLDEVAAIVGVHRVTVSKSLARIRDELSAALARDLAERLRDEDVADALELVRSRLTLSFERLLIPDPQ